MITTDQIRNSARMSGGTTNKEALLEIADYIDKIERDNADLRQRNESVLNGQELLRQQAARIRHAALGITAEAEDTAPDTDTEDIVRDLAAARQREGEIRAKAIEECAMKCEQRAESVIEGKAMANQCARDIRALAGATNTNPVPQLGVRDGMLRAAEICDKVGARLSAGAGYACKIAAEEIRNSA